MPRLPIDSDSKRSSTAWQFIRGRIRRTNKAILRSHKIRVLRGKDLPIRLRPWFLCFTSLLLILLGILGFTNLARSFPLNDKILHFVCLGTATGVFYWIFDVDEDARRIWFWRHFGLICTFVLCFFFGGILSEFVQSLLPYKTFDSGDVFANLLGSTCGLFISYHLERYYRHRREIARLYQPLDATEEEAASDDELDTLNATLPLYRQTSQSLASPSQTKSAQRPRQERQLRNVWDSREDLLFSVGEDDEDDEGVRPSRDQTSKSSSPARI